MDFRLIGWLELFQFFYRKFSLHRYQLLMDHVDQLKLAQADKILNGDLPPTREVQQMRNFLLSQVNDRYRSANEETVALDIQVSFLFSLNSNTFPLTKH